MGNHKDFHIITTLICENGLISGNYHQKTPHFWGFALYGQSTQRNLRTPLLNLKLAISLKSVIRYCVRRQMLPPALGGLRVLRAAGPGPSCAREYGKDHARHRGRCARPSTEQVNYSKMPLQIARVGF